MTGVDPNRLLREAEQHFAAGRHAAARPLLERVLRLVPGHPAVLHLYGLVLSRLGALAAARAALEGARRGLPGDPQVANNLGNLLGRMGERRAALAAYDEAIRANPGFAQARLNRAITLDELGRHGEARAAFEAMLADGPASADLLVAAASAARNDGDLPAAAAWLDRALGLDPAHRTALTARARVALDGGEDDAGARYRRALATPPPDRDLLIDYLDAAETPARRAEAIDGVAALLAADPGWHAGHRALAAARWRSEDYADSYRAALTARPGDAALWRDYAAALGRADDFAGAAEACLAAEQATGEAAFAGGAFGHLSAAGEMARAEALLARLPEGAVSAAARAKHRLRARDPAGAEALLASVLAAAPDDIEAWALIGICWELTGDPRAHWLNRQEGLVGVHALPVSAEEIGAIAAQLRRVHETSFERVGQSVRGGTQTMGNLFDRREPAFQRLRAMIGEAVEAHRAGLPPADPAHPLLKHRERRFAFAGSWSIRLAEGGFHVAHIHPKGILSAASWWVVPEVGGDDPFAGQLEIGGAPAYLGLDLPPLARIAPQPGRLALFPSTLHHGTRPFAAGERISVAFDVAASSGS